MERSGFCRCGGGTSSTRMVLAHSATRGVSLFHHIVIPAYFINICGPCGDASEIAEEVLAADTVRVPAGAYTLALAAF